MLLAVDIGNTNIKFGIYDGEILVKKFHIPTDRDASSDELATAIRASCPFPVNASLACSVVPEINDRLNEAISHVFGITPTFVKNDSNLGLDIRYEPLSAAGTDRLVNVFSAVEKYGGPCIVCSFGTALTMDAVDKNRVLRGGLIAPGMKTMARSLNLYTSKLPDVAIAKPASAIQNTTVGSIQSGIVYGYFGLVTSLIERVKSESSIDAKVIATGGFAQMISENVDLIDVIDENLLLDGLMRLNKRYQPA